MIETIRNNEYLDYVVSLQRQLISVKDVAHEYKARVEGLINEKTRYQEEVECKNNYISKLEKLLEESSKRNLIANDLMEQVTSKIEEPIKLLTSTVKEELYASTMNLKSMSLNPVQDYEDEMREEVRRLKRELAALKEENGEMYAQLREIHESSTIPMSSISFTGHGYNSLPGSRSGSRSCSCSSDSSGQPTQSSPIVATIDAGHHIAAVSTPVLNSHAYCSFHGHWRGSLRRRTNEPLTGMMASTPNLKCCNHDDESIKVSSSPQRKSIGVNCILEESLNDDDLDRIWTLLPSGEDLDSNSYEQVSKSLKLKSSWADGFKYKMTRRKSGVPSNSVMVKLSQLIDRFVIARSRKPFDKNDKIV